MASPQVGLVVELVVVLVEAGGPAPVSVRVRVRPSRDELLCDLQVPRVRDFVEGAPVRHLARVHGGSALEQ